MSAAFGDDRLRQELEDAKARISALESRLAACEAAPPASFPSGHLLDLILDNTDDIISSIGRDYVYQTASRSYERISRIPKERIVGSTVSEVLGESFFQDEVRPLLDRCFEGETLQKEGWFSFQPSGRRYMNVTFTPLRDHDGGIVSALVIARDITPRMQTSKALEERDRTLRSILEAAPLLICLVTQDNMVWSNSQIKTMLGYDYEEAEGAPLAWFFRDPDEYAGIREAILEQLRTQGSSMFEAELRHKRGSAVPVVIRLAPLDPLRPDKEAICIVTDISYRKRWERAILEREARYRDIFDNAPVGILRTDFSGQVLQLNQALAEMLGYDTPQKAISDFGHDILQIYSDSGRREELKRTLLEHGAVRDFEVEWIDSQGQKKILLLNLRYIRDGEKQLIDGFATDLTEKRRAELENRERDKQLIQADKLISLGVLSSGVAHEINNPNNFIGINAPLLQKAWEGMAPLLDQLAEEEGDFRIEGMPYSRLRQHVPRLIDGIISGSQRIQHIVENMRRLASPDMDSSAENVDLNALVLAAVPFVKPRASKFRCRMELDLDESLPSVKGSARQLEQVILNLMLNGLDAMADSGGTLLIRTGQNADEAWLTVKDSGAGLDRSVESQIFTPFFTTKRAHGGTGLGLAISDKIMQSHKGRIELRNNEPEPGATATMTLPLATGSSEVSP